MPSVAATVPESQSLALVASARTRRRRVISANDRPSHVTARHESRTLVGHPGRARPAAAARRLRRWPGAADSHVTRDCRAAAAAKPAGPRACPRPLRLPTAAVAVTVPVGLPGAVKHYLSPRARAQAEPPPTFQRLSYSDHQLRLPVPAGECSASAAVPPRSPPPQPPPMVPQLVNLRPGPGPFSDSESLDGAVPTLWQTDTRSRRPQSPAACAGPAL